MRHRYAVVHLDPAVKLNMTDDQWVQQVAKNMSEGAKQELAKTEKRNAKTHLRGGSVLIPAPEGTESVSSRCPA